MTTVKYVLVTTTARPRMLHRTDCPHPPAELPAKWRLASAEELRELSRCYHCNLKDAPT